MVQQFTEAFVQALQVPDGPTSDSGFKMEVLKVRTRRRPGPRCPGAAAARPHPVRPSALSLRPQAVTALVKNFPKHMVSSMQQILPIVWNTLTDSAALYPFPERGAAAADQALTASALPVSWNLRVVSPSLVDCVYDRLPVLFLYSSSYLREDGSKLHGGSGRSRGF